MSACISLLVLELLAKMGLLMKQSVTSKEIVMDSDSILVICIFLAFVLFLGEPDLLDAVIANLMK